MCSLDCAGRSFCSDTSQIALQSKQHAFHSETQAIALSMLLRRLTRLEGSLLRVFPLSSCSIPMARRTRSTAAKYEEASMPSLPDSKISQTKRDADNLDNQPRSPKAEADDARESSSPPKKKTKRTAEPRAKKEPPDHSAFEYPVRTVATSSKALGFHASTSGGVELSCINALKQGATGFALFLSESTPNTGLPCSTDDDVGG